MLSKVLHPGFTLSIKSRDAESFIRCPMRSYLSNKNNVIGDLKTELHKSLDSTLTYTFVKSSVGLNINVNDMIRFFDERFVYPEEEVRQVYVQEGSKILREFYSNFEAFKKRYEIVHPPFELDYTNYGVTIKILVNAIVKTKYTSGLPITKYLFFDYSKSINNSWSSFSRLWASVSKQILLNNGISTIETAAFHVVSGKLMNPKITLKNNSTEYLDSICLLLATKAKHPIYSGSCFKCLLQAECASEVTF